MKKVIENVEYLTKEDVDDILAGKIDAPSLHFFSQYGICVGKITCYSHGIRIQFGDKLDVTVKKTEETLKSYLAMLSKDKDSFVSKIAGSRYDSISIDRFISYDGMIVLKEDGHTDDPRKIRFYDSYINASDDDFIIDTEAGNTITFYDGDNWFGHLDGENNRIAALNKNDDGFLEFTVDLDMKRIINFDIWKTKCKVIRNNTMKCKTVILKAKAVQIDHSESEDGTWYIAFDIPEEGSFDDVKKRRPQKYSLTLLRVDNVNVNDPISIVSCMKNGINMEYTSLVRED